MKINEPLTGHEVVLDEHRAIVSTTDLKGIITHVNETFIEISGFSETELIGANHNLVRHPDVPPAAFKDLWDTVQAGKPWTGIVKNRCKSGDHYWVEANVAPIFEAGKTTGYLSVRRKPSRESIAAAETLYQQVADGKVRIREGRVIGSAWKQWINPFRNLSILSKLLLLTGLPILAILAFSFLLIQEKLSDLNDVRKEQHGSAYLAPVGALMSNLDEHRLLTARLISGVASAADRLSVLDNAVNTDLDALRLLSSDDKDRFGLQEKLTGTTEYWTEIVDSYADFDTNESTGVHTELRSDLIGLYRLLGKNSGLSADSAPVTQHWIALLTDLIPRIRGYLGEAAAYLEPLARDGELDEEAIESLISGYFSLVTLDENLRWRISEIIEITPAAQETIATALSEYKYATVGILLGLEEIKDSGNLTGDTSGLNPLAFVERSMQAEQALIQLYEIARQTVSESLDRREKSNSNDVMLTLAMAAGTVLATLLLMYFLLKRSVVQPLQSTLDIFRRVGEGDYHNRIDVDRNDEIGNLLRGLKMMQTKLGFDLMRAQDETNAATRIKTALDCVSTNVMVADKDYQIIYLNPAVQKMFGEAETDLREQLPEFAADKMLGRNIDLFHQNPAHQRNILEQLDSTYQSQIKVGHRTLRIIANPVINDAGERLGTAVEWADLTAELNARQEENLRLEEERRHAAENLRIRTALDNVSSCVMLADAQNDIIYINRSALAMFAVAETYIRRQMPDFHSSQLVGQSVERFYRQAEPRQVFLEQLQAPHTIETDIGGRIFRIVANPVRSEQGKRLGTAVEWTDRTAEVAVEQEIDGIVEAARAGDLSQRISLDGKQGFFHELGAGINDLIGIVERVFDDLAHIMAEMAQGDLTQSIEQNYQGSFARVQNNVSDTLNRLQRIVGELRESADFITTVSEEINGGNTNLSGRTEQQASSLEETASSMEELTSTVRNNADNAQQANSLAGAARNEAEQGGLVVNRAVRAMEAINNSSSKIAEIISVIDVIAFQTNLLALNASVEAARAGEQGRGFAVVATEVRNLASRSAAAAKQIKTLIQDSVDKIQSGTELVNESGKTLDDIVGAVKKVGDIVADIAAASTEQSAGIDQVNQAVTSMDEVTQQNAALAEQTSAASASLQEKAQEMASLVGFFKISE